MSMSEGIKVSMSNTGELLEGTAPTVDGGKSNVRALNIEDRLDCPRLGPIPCIFVHITGPGHKPSDRPPYGSLFLVSIHHPPVVHR